MLLPVAWSVTFTIVLKGSFYGRRVIPLPSYRFPLAVVAPV